MHDDVVVRRPFELLSISSTNRPEDRVRSRPDPVGDDLPHLRASVPDILSDPFREFEVGFEFLEFIDFLAPFVQLLLQPLNLGRDVFELVLPFVSLRRELRNLLVQFVESVVELLVFLGIELRLNGFTLFNQRLFLLLKTL